MSEKSIEDQLVEGRELLKELIAQRKHHSIGPQYGIVLEKVLRLERLAAEKCGEAYASKWEIPEIWHGMTVDCMVLGDQLKCLVIFEAKIKSGQFKILEFHQTASYRLTDVSDDIMAAHPLSGRGLTAYGSFLIKNSPWLKEVEMINRSHPQFDQKEWQKTKHYMLCFKNRMFEALATEAGLAGEATEKEIAIANALNRLK